MKKYRVAISMALALLFAAAGHGLAADDVNTIVEKANNASYYGGDDGKARVKMVMTSASGSERSREFTILRKDIKDGGDQLFYIYFHKPGDVKKTVFLVHKKVDGDDDRWLYLPALDLVKRIAASDKRTSFVGSHFFYEDVSGRNLTEDEHVLEATTEDSYIISNTPKNPGSVEFSSYKMWIDKETYLPMKAEYLDKQGELYRVVEALEVEEVGGIPTVVKARVKDIPSGGETVMNFSDVKYDLGIDESIFTERYLRKLPRKYIRR